MDELVDGHQLDGGDPERGEVLDDHRVGDGGVGPADVVRDGGVVDREAADVGLVDHGLVDLVVGRAVVAPVEERIADDGARDVRGAVVDVRLVGVVELVREAGRVPRDLAVDGLGVGVEEQLGRVAPQALGRLPRAVDPVAVALARTDVGEVGVPAVAVDLGQRDAHLGQRLARLDDGGDVLEQAELDALGGAAEQREVRARPVVHGAQRVRAADPLADRRRLGGPGRGPSARRHPRILAADGRWCSAAGSRSPSSSGWWSGVRPET